MDSLHTSWYEMRRTALKDNLDIMLDYVNGLVREPLDWIWDVYFHVRMAQTLIDICE